MSAARRPGRLERRCGKEAPSRARVTRLPAGAGCCVTATPAKGRRSHGLEHETSTEVERGALGALGYRQGHGIGAAVVPGEPEPPPGSGAPAVGPVACEPYATGVGE